jgi:hypothetical protein
MLQKCIFSFENLSTSSFAHELEVAQAWSTVNRPSDQSRGQHSDPPDLKLLKASPLLEGTNDHFHFHFFLRQSSTF